MPLLYTFALLSFTAVLTSDSWELLSFDNVPRGDVEFSRGGIRVEVDDSATPLVQRFKFTKRVTSVKVSGFISGDLNIPEGSLWESGFDDAYLRFGLIEAGDVRLSPLQKLTAPDWVKRVDSLFSETGGISKIHTFQVLNHDTWVGKERVNPANSLFYEKIISTPGDDGSFQIVAKFEKPLDVVGLWILADGDDTGSRFEVRVESIKMK